MKKVLWMLVAVAMLGLCAKAADQAAGGDKAHNKPVTVNGTIKVDGDKVCLAGDDGTTYVLKSKHEKTITDLKAQDGQKVELKGWVKDDNGTKTLNVMGDHGHGKKKDAGAAPAAGGNQ